MTKFFIKFKNPVFDFYVQFCLCNYYYNLDNKGIRNVRLHQFEYLIFHVTVKAYFLSGPCNFKNGFSILFSMILEVGLLYHQGMVFLSILSQSHCLLCSLHY